MQSRTSNIFALAVVVGLGGMMVPETGWAQDDPDAPPEAEDSEAPSGSESDSDTSDSDSQTADDGSDGNASDSAPQASADDSDGDTASQDEQDDGEAENQGDDTRAARGPGGRDLREDYPGKEEAMKGQMDTDRIEGLEFEEADKPSEAYDLKLKELETKIDDLKEKVFQSKSRVVLLKETVLGGNLSGSRATIVHTSDLGARFKLRRALYSLDGSRIYNEADEENGLSKDDFEVFDGSITAGNHNVSVVLDYQGSGFGLFNYMKGYRFKITSSCQFKAEEGKATMLKVRTVDKGGAFSGVQNKPGIKCEITTTELSDDAAEELDDDSGQAGSGSNSGQ